MKNLFSIRKNRIRAERGSVLVEASAQIAVVMAILVPGIVFLVNGKYDVENQRYHRDQGLYKTFTVAAAAAGGSVGTIIGGDR